MRLLGRPVIYNMVNEKLGLWKERKLGNLEFSRSYVKPWCLMFCNSIVSFKIILCCDLQFSCGACSPEPFGSNSGSSLLKLAQDLPAKSTTEICFLQICKVHNYTWKLHFKLINLWVTILNCIPYQPCREPHQN